MADQIINLVTERRRATMASTELYATDLSRDLAPPPPASDVIVTLAISADQPVDLKTFAGDTCSPRSEHSVVSPAASAPRSSGGLDRLSADPTEYDVTCSDDAVSQNDDVFGDVTADSDDVGDHIDDDDVANGNTELSGVDVHGMFMDTVGDYRASDGCWRGDESMITDGDKPPLTQPVKFCRVCGDTAAGIYFGALVCVPCKTFFLRYAGQSVNFVCPNAQNCEMTINTRTQCKHCRYNKCLCVGMRRKVRPAQVTVSEGQQVCVVCGDIGNGVHFGAVTCEGCKKFYRRGITEHKNYMCKYSGSCEINPRTRNSCRYCRFQKCIDAGMSRGAIQMGRPSKARLSSSRSESHAPASEGRPPGTSLIQNGSISPQNLAKQSSGISVAVADTTSRPGSPDENVSPAARNRTANERSFTGQCFASRLSNGVARQLITMAAAEKAEDLVKSRTGGLLGGCQDVTLRHVKYRKRQIPGLGGTVPLSADRCSDVTVMTEVASDVSALNRQLSCGTYTSSLSPSSERDLEDGMGSPLVTTSGRRFSFDNEEDSAVKRSRADSFQMDVVPEDGVTATADQAGFGCLEEPFSMNKLMAFSQQYWLQPLPNSPIPDQLHSAILNGEVFQQAVKAYEEFVNESARLNLSLDALFHQAVTKAPEVASLPGFNAYWIHEFVIKPYTQLSSDYCRALPGFSSFQYQDQVTIMRYGQSSSRILMAAFQWFDDELNDFHSFLSWRNVCEDMFKQQLIQFAKSLRALRPQVDKQEQALLNALAMIATDYPNLVNPESIQKMRQSIIQALQAYTTGDRRLSGCRLASMFALMPEARRLGLLHYTMTKTRTLTAEEVKKDVYARK